MKLFLTCEIVENMELSIGTPFIVYSLFLILSQDIVKCPVRYQVENLLEVLEVKICVCYILAHPWKLFW